MYIIIMYILLIIIIILIIFLKGELRFFEHMDNISTPIPIGNYLCREFYLMGCSFRNNKDYTPSYSNIPHFPTNFICDTNIHKQLLTLPDYVFNISDRVGTWCCNDNNINSFWYILKPYINKILNELFTKNNLQNKVDYPVIHYRCSDVPFVKHFHYHLVKYKFYKDALEELKKNGINTQSINLMSCNTHINNNTEKCNQYTQSLKKYLEDLGYNVIMSCGTNIDDFATIFYSPASISNGSSFSFMSGYFGNGIFISEGHVDEHNINKKCTNCNWLKSGYTLLHKDVDNYYDTDTVIKQLLS